MFFLHAAPGSWWVKGSMGLQVQRIITLDSYVSSPRAFLEVHMGEGQSLRKGKFTESGEPGPSFFSPIWWHLMRVSLYLWWEKTPIFNPAFHLNGKGCLRSITPSFSHSAPSWLLREEEAVSICLLNLWEEILHVEINPFGTSCIGSLAMAHRNAICSFLHHGGGQGQHCYFQSGRRRRKALVAVTKTTISSRVDTPPFPS
jgi:hypothetical protein